MKENNKSKTDKTLEAVTHTHTHTHGIFNKLNNKKIIIAIVIIIVIILISVILVKRNNTNKISGIKFAQEEQETINLNVEIKQETDETYKCLLTFTSTDENEKIKEIEYPTEEGKEAQIIRVGSIDGKEKVGIDYDLKKNDVDKTFKVITTKGNTFNERTGYTITYNDNNGSVFKTETILKGSNITQINITNLAPKQEGKHFLGWSEEKQKTEPDYFENGEYNVYGEDKTLYAIWTDQKNGYKENIENESLIGKISKINTSGEQSIIVNGVNYTANVIVENNDLVLDGEKQVQGATLSNKVYEFGDSSQDVATASEDAKNMVILKVHGNLTINSNVTLTACKSENGYGGPKGLFIYVTGTISNNGTIDMTKRGAKAEGQDVYLWQNKNNSYEYIQAEGGIGGQSVTRTDIGSSFRKSRRKWSR